MKYFCINKFKASNNTIMSPGDVVVFEGNKLYNVTTGMELNDISDPEEIINNYLSLTPIKLDIIRERAEYVDTFALITDEMINTFERKNKDYGNSFEQSLDEEGLAAARIRMGDKWNRFKTLSNGNKSFVKDESIRDTLLDMANYCIMTVMWLDKHSNV